MRRVRLVGAAIAVFLAGGPSLADCASLDKAVKAAIATGDAKALPGLAAALAAEASCDGAYVLAARRSIALAILAAGQTAGGHFDQAAVRSAAAIARPWQVSMAYGDL